MYVLDYDPKATYIIYLQPREGCDAQRFPASYFYGTDSELFYIFLLQPSKIVKWLFLHTSTI